MRFDRWKWARHSDFESTAESDARATTGDPRFREIPPEDHKDNEIGCKKIVVKKILAISRARYPRSPRTVSLVPLVGLGLLPDRFARRLAVTDGLPLGLLSCRRGIPARGRSRRGAARPSELESPLTGMGRRVGRAGQQLRRLGLGLGGRRLGGRHRSHRRAFARLQAVGGHDVELKGNNMLAMQ